MKTIMTFMAKLPAGRQTEHNAFSGGKRTKRIACSHPVRALHKHHGPITRQPAAEASAGAMAARRGKASCAPARCLDARETQRTLPPLSARRCRGGFVDQGLRLAPLQGQRFGSRRHTRSRRVRIDEPPVRCSDRAACVPLRFERLGSEFPARRAALGSSLSLTLRRCNAVS